MVEVFKTDVQRPDQSKPLIRQLQRQLPGTVINFDLDDCDRILRIAGLEVPPALVIGLLEDHGYRCEVLV